MSTVLTELLASPIPAVGQPMVLALCMGEGGIDDKAWWRCYGDKVGGPTSYQGPLDVVFNSANKLWAGKSPTGSPKDISHALGAGQFQPATYEEAAARTGLPTLAPQSQLANIWNHLQHVYTGDLVADLAAGMQAEIAAALPSTWTSLGNAATFKNHYESAVKTLAAAKPVTPPVVPYIPPQPPAPSLPAPTPADDLDPEVQAMSDILDILQGLAMDGRERVIAYVTARFLTGDQGNHT